MATVNVPNDAGTWLLLLASISPCNTFTTDYAGRWNWEVARTSNAGGDFPGSGFPQYISPLNIIPTFGVAAILVPHGTTPQQITVNNGSDGFPLFGVITNGLIGVGSVIGTDHYFATFGPSDIAAANPVSAASYDLYVRIADTDLSDNTPHATITATAAITGSAAPSAPTITGTSFALNSTNCVVSVTLNWSSVAGATSYSVYRNGNLLQNLINPATLAYTDTTALVGVTYAYVVRVFNSCGSTDSTPAIVTPITGLVAPTLTACASCCRKQIILAWNAIASPYGTVTGYMLSRNDGATWTFPANILTYTDAAIDDLTTYTYAVVALMGTCWTGPAGTANIRMYGYSGPLLPSTVFATGAQPTNTFGTPSVPTNTWKKPGCGCD